MISVGLVDDQALVRQGIAKLIELSAIATVAWQCEDAEDGLAKLAQTPVDVLVCDIRMPGMGGIELVRRLREQGETQAVLMLTTFDDHQLFLDALGAGANGFLLKDVSLEKLISAIETLAGGGFVAEPRLVSQAGAPHAQAPPLTSDLLTSKEREVLKLAAGGLSNREIAGIVHLAEGTVKNHLSTIFTKLNCRDRTQAVLYAIHWQLI